MGLKRTRIFVSYRHADYRVLETIRNYIGWLENDRRITVFDDRSILAGDNWDQCIKRELDVADIVILIVTASFMRSAYCTNIELRVALERRAANGIRVVPIIAESCDWEAMPIGAISALPKDRANNLKPLNKWGRDRDVALTQITQQIRENVERIAVNRRSPTQDLSHQKKLTTAKGFAPVVLVVDDDPTAIRRWRSEIYKSTILGVITAGSLAEARCYIDDRKLEINAIIADIYFEANKDDPEYGLIDGIDFLVYSAQKRPAIPLYIASASAEMLNYKERLCNSGISIAAFFDKLAIAHYERPAWVIVQDGIINNLGVSDLFTENASVESLSNVLIDLRPIVRTYLQNLGRKSLFSVIRPIEVVCLSNADGLVRAYVPALGLLSIGCGEDTRDAIEDLECKINEELMLVFDRGIESSGHDHLIAQKVKHFIKRR